MENNKMFHVEKDIASIYNEMLAIARNRLRQESNLLTLNTSDLVHETYISMSKQSKKEYNDKNHFMAIATISMRRLLVNHARRKAAIKHGGNHLRVTLGGPENMASEIKEDEIIDLDDALERYQFLNDRGSKVIQYWFFGGFKQQEIADLLSISLATVKREWQLARVWLNREMRQSQRHAI